MCYKSPGPRCSAHAKKRYILLRQNLSKVRSDLSWEETREKLDEIEKAEFDFDSTPVGQARLELKTKQGDHRGEFAERLENGKKLRRLQLDAIKSQEMGDIYDHNISHQSWKASDLQGKRSARPNWNTEKGHKKIESYIDYSINFSQKLSVEQATAIYWHTSDGSSVVNNIIHSKNQNESGKWTYGNMENSTLKNKYSKTMIKNQVKLLDSVFKEHSMPEPTVLYRGIGMNNFPDELRNARGNDPAITEYLSEKYPVGETIDIPEYMSTSADPAVAHKFSGFQNVALEIKTKRAIPVGGVSAWDASEREFIVNRNGKYKVVSILKNVTYKDVYTKNRPKGTDNKEMIIIQLEEV